VVVGLDRSPSLKRLGDDMLATKLHVPSGRGRLVTRQRLLDRLTHGMTGRLTMVSAPAGWGKTTLVLDWCRRAAAPSQVAWVSLDREDSDPARFWAYACTSLAGSGALDLEAPLRLLTDPRVDITRTFIPRLLNALDAGLRHRVVLVLDDYHLVDSREVDDQLAYVVEHAPWSLHVVVVSRTRPALPLPRLRARGDLTEIRTGDLRFSPSESAELLTEVLGLHLSWAAVMQLSTRTEGWAVALHLCALQVHLQGETSSTTSRFPGAFEHVVEYVGAEVLGSLDEELRSFVLQTSVLDRMCASLCDAVTGRSDSARLLRQVDDHNLFLVHLDDRREWFRYHHLFAEVMQRELVRLGPELPTGLHRRASEWYDGAGLTSEAIRHALAANDSERAQRLVSRHWNRYYNLGRLSTVAGWLDALGEPLVHGDAWLSAARLMLWADQGRLDELDAWLRADRQRVVDGYPYALLRALLRFKSGDLDESGRELEQAELIRTDSEPFWPTVEHCVRGAVSYWTGDTAGARSALGTAVELAHRHGNAAGRGYAQGYLCLMAVDDGDSATAARILEDLDPALRPDADLATHFSLTPALVASGRMSAGAGAVDQAQRRLERALSVARLGAGRLEVVLALTAVADARHAGGDRAGADVAWSEASSTLSRCRHPGRASRLVPDPLPMRQRRPRVPREPLTARETAVLRLLPSDLSLRAIGASLFVSHNTVKTHTRTLYRKLAATTRDEAVIAAREAGLL
jgi:LuxR family transcriptional regulator, maltose regulon positive regulatory protein